MSEILSSNPEGFDFRQVKQLASVYETTSSEKRERRRAEDAMNKLRELLTKYYPTVGPSLKEDCVILLNKIQDFENLNMMVFASAFYLLTRFNFELSPIHFSPEQVDPIIAKINEQTEVVKNDQIGVYHMKMQMQLLRYCRLITEARERS